MAKTTPSSEIIVGLDIGSTKIAAIVGEVADDGIDIIGVGTAPSRGMRKGVVSNIDATVQAIQKAIGEAEGMASCEISMVYAGISGAHIRGVNSHGIVGVNNREVRDADVTRVIEAARAVAIPADREVLHVLPQQYIVDEHDGIRDPLGMAGVRLEAQVHIVTTMVTSAQNVVKCANRCGLEVAEIVLEPLASAYAVLEEAEKELGVALIDFGGGTCDMVLYVDGAIVHSAVLGLGGGHVTNDIAAVLRTPQDEAEKIKMKYGCASLALVNSGELIEVPSVGGREARQLPRANLAEIIEPRIEEIFDLVREELVRSKHLESLAAGVVLTGGGAAMDGICEVAERVLGLPARRGLPMPVGGLTDVVKSPSYAAGVGLVQYGARAARHSAQRLQAAQHHKRGLLRRAWAHLSAMF